MRPKWKKISFIVADCLLAVYLLLAITAFNKPKDDGKLCETVVINIADENTNGFLTAEEIKQLLVDKKVYPKNIPLSRINPRQIEELLYGAPFVNTAQCYKTTGGKVYIEITQRTPLIRIKSQNGDDYYIDDKGGIMPNSKYTSDLIIATGNINRRYAREYITPMSTYIMADDFWRNQIEQINVLPDKSIELVPRIGNHIIKIGQLPTSSDAKRRNSEIEEMLNRKFTRLKKFYKYGLGQVGWNRYDYIDIEFDNQIICRRNDIFNDSEHQPKAETIEEEPAPVPNDSASVTQEGQSIGNNPTESHT